MTERVLAAVGLGSNLGDRERTLAQAIDELRRHPDLELLRVSPWLENAAVGGPAGQPDYLNGVLLVRTSLGPQALLSLLLEVEAAHGRDREREGVNGARTLDLDLLLHGDCIVSREELVVPHPRMLERDFVLAPLARVAPELRIPHTGRSVRDEAHRLALRILAEPVTSAAEA